MRVLLPIVVGLCLAGCAAKETAPTPAASVEHPDPEVAGIVRREIVQRQARMHAAEEAIARGDALMRGKDAEAALEAYREAMALGR